MFGSFTNSKTNYKDRIKEYINSINTDNKNVIFNVLLIGAGTFNFVGYVYNDKTYGCGILQFYDAIIRWRRNTSTDYFYDINITAI